MRPSLSQGTFMSWLERFAVPEAARLDFRSGTKLDAVAHKLMSRRGATVFCMMAFITIGLTAFWHAEVTQRDRFEGAASATAIPMTTRSLQAVKNLLLAAWYPVALERCTSRPLAQLFIAIHAADSCVDLRRSHNLPHAQRNLLLHPSIYLLHSPVPPWFRRVFGVEGRVWLACNERARDRRRRCVCDWPLGDSQAWATGR